MSRVPSRHAAGPGVKIRTGCGPARVATEAGSRFRVDLEDGPF
ncbi:hypothetical protein ACFYNW_04405 [Streptomyces virginiae]